MSKIIPYKGREPYVFISYAHKDGAEVRAVLERMQKDGYRLWFDEGIDPGTEWDDVIAAHVKKCDYFIAFMSENYLASDNCKDELNYARDLGKKQLLVYLCDANLPDGMAMRLGRLQNVGKHRYARAEDFYEKLYEADGLGAFRSSGHEATASEATASEGRSPEPPQGEEENVLLFLPDEETGGYFVSGLFKTVSGSIEIPDTYRGKPVTGIGDGAFEGRTDIVSVAIPASVRTIGERAFCGCEGLEDIDIPDSVVSIEDEAFRGCIKIQYIIIPRLVSYVGDGSFADCVALESIVVDKKNRTYHGKNNCLIETKSKTLIIGCKCSEIPADGSVKSIAWGGFSGCEGLAFLDLPASVTSVDERAFMGCSALEYICVSRANKTYRSEGECLIEKARGRVILGCKTSEIPNDGSIKEIGPFAFYERAGEAALPEGVWSIDFGAFACSPKCTSVNIPSSVTFIDDRAFGDCEALRIIRFDGTVAEWKAIEKIDGWCEGTPEDLKIVCCDGTVVK